MLVLSAPAQKKTPGSEPGVFFCAIMSQRTTCALRHRSADFRHPRTLRRVYPRHTPLLLRRGAKGGTRTAPPEEGNDDPVCRAAARCDIEAPTSDIPRATARYPHHNPL